MYNCVMAREAFEKVETYLDKLKQGWVPGNFLAEKLKNYYLEKLNSEDFLEVLVNTKRPQIFAESAVCGNGLDWNLEELSILGDLGIAVPVEIYDNGQHHFPDVHIKPIKGNLLYIPGALLDSSSETPADWGEVTENKRIALKAYSKLYQRRLLPLFQYANDKCRDVNKFAFITIPGLGCGQFAGPFRGHLGTYLRLAIKSILEENIKDLTNIKAIYFDPYEECENSRYEIENISFLVRPLTKGNFGKSQLADLHEFNEGSDDFADCELFSIVAWDHVSWPGNDFYGGARMTDDGVKAAATDSMHKLTGVEGVYDKNIFKYEPPSDYTCWREVVYKNKLKIKVKDNLIVF